MTFRYVHVRVTTKYLTLSKDFFSCATLVSRMLVCHQGLFVHYQIQCYAGFTQLGIHIFYV